MKDIVIGDVTYPLTYGMEFIFELDKRFGSKLPERDRFAGGLPVALSMLDMGDLPCLVDLIEAATITEKKRPDKKAIGAWIFEQEDLEAVVEDFLGTLRKQPALTFVLKQMDKQAQKQATNQFLASR